MSRHLAALLLVASLFFCLAAAPPAAKGPVVAEVTGDQMWKDSQKYHGKMVQVEVTVPKEMLVKQSGDRFSYAMDVGGKEEPVHVLCPGKPDCKEGDRLRVTGRFDLRAPTFARYRVDATAEGGKVEKIPAKK